MLADARARRREFGAETPLELPFSAAVKTGTSKSFCDNFVVGFTPEITVAAWVGNFDGRPMRGLLAMQGAAPLWREAMLVAMQDRPHRAFERPVEVESVELCALSGKRRGPHCPAGRHDHVASGKAAASCDWHGAGGALRVPPELIAFGPSAASVLPSAGRAIEITSPVADARFVIDPLLPRSRQKLLLRALVRSPEISRLIWEIDGHAIAEVAAPFSTDWPISKGVHRVRAVAIGQPSNAHEIRIEVNGE
jgi:penicillin-binding protein 1C